MTAFASRTPRDLNRDPIPYIERAGEVFYEPRPEFDHAQHNPPNPILVQFRDNVARRGEHPYWGDTWDSTMDYIDWALDSPLVARGDRAHIDHARKVLTRLANLARNGADDE